MAGPSVQRWRSRPASFFQPVSDSNLAKKRAEQLSIMPSQWRWDDQVDKGLRLAQSEIPGFEVLWPTGLTEEGATSLSSDDLEQAKYMLDLPSTRTIVVPHNTGNHWYPVCLQRDSQGKWQSYALQTKMDGSCGDDLVLQAREFATQGAEAYRTKKDLSHSPSSASVLEKACLMSLSETTRFDFELSRLANYELLFKDATVRDDQGAMQHCEAVINKCKTNAVELLQGMDEKDSKAAIGRLCASGLDRKPSIGEIIDQVHEEPVTQALRF